MLSDEQFEELYNNSSEEDKARWTQMMDEVSLPLEVFKKTLSGKYDHLVGKTLSKENLWAVREEAKQILIDWFIDSAEVNEFLVNVSVKAVDNLCPDTGKIIGQLFSINPSNLYTLLLMHGLCIDSRAIEGMHGYKSSTGVIYIYTEEQSVVFPFDHPISLRFDMKQADEDE